MTSSRTSPRALLVGLLAPALGATAHVQAGGGLPAVTPGLATVALAVAVLAAGLARRSSGARDAVGVPVVAGVLASGQVVWHLALSTPGAGHHAMTGMDAAGMVPTPGMVAAHLLTTTVVALGIVGADRALLLAVVARLRTALRVRVGPPPPAPSSSLPPVVARPDVFRRRAEIVRCRPHRGPPVTVA